MDFNLDDLNNYDVGQPMNEPMNESQRNYIEQLIHTCSLIEPLRQGYRMALDCGLNYNEAEDIIEELKEVQVDTLSQDIGTLRRTDLNKGLLKLVRRDNT